MIVRAASIDLNPEVFQACLGDLGKFCSPASKKTPSDDEDGVIIEEDEEDNDDFEEEEGMTCLEDHMNQLQVSLSTLLLCWRPLWS